MLASTICCNNLRNVVMGNEAGQSHRGHRRIYREVIIAPLIVIQWNLRMESMLTTPFFRPFCYPCTCSGFLAHFANIFLCLQRVLLKTRILAIRIHLASFGAGSSFTDCFYVYCSPWLSPFFFSQA